MKATTTTKATAHTQQLTDSHQLAQQQQRRGRLHCPLQRRGLHERHHGPSSPHRHRNNKASSRRRRPRIPSPSDTCPDTYGAASPCDNLDNQPGGRRRGGGNSSRHSSRRPRGAAWWGGVWAGFCRVVSTAKQGKSTQKTGAEPKML